MSLLLRNDLGCDADVQLSLLNKSPIPHGPYDVIILDGATEVLPNGLYRQLKMGGRLAGVFAQALPAKAWLVTRSPADFGNRVLFDASAEVLPGLERIPAFSF